VIIDNPDQHRYEIRVSDELAGFVQYRRREGLIGARFEGQGLGSQLIAAVLDEARAAGVAVFPFCPFVNGFISRHPEYVDLVPEEFRSEFGL
jgi:predicted GNAT family acetyltransferase